MSDMDAYDKAAAGLEAAAKALRACGAEESSEDESAETPREKQPTNLRDAEKETRRRYAAARASDASK